MDHWQRVDAALSGAPVDRPPIALWRHFPDDDQDPGVLTAHSVAWQQRWDFDLVKFMPSGTYGVEDWGAVSASTGRRTAHASSSARACAPPTTGARSATSMSGAAATAAPTRRSPRPRRRWAATSPILQTVFTPLTTARKLSTDRLYADLRRSPDAVHAALEAITAVTIGSRSTRSPPGAHGIFYATQVASYRLLSDAEHDEFGRRYDLRVLEALAGRARLSMLHVHGDDIHFDRLAGYPVEMINWHDRIARPTLREAAQRSARLLVGGLNENGPLARGDLAAIRAEVTDAIDQTGGRRLMIGPGCVVPIRVADAAIETAIRATHDAAGRA